MITRIDHRNKNTYHTLSILILHNTHFTLLYIATKEYHEKNMKFYKLLEFRKLATNRIQITEYYNKSHTIYKR